MARNLFRNTRYALARLIAGPSGKRAFDAASWKRFPREARSGRAVQDVLMAAPQVRSRARYYAGSDPLAAAGVNALTVYGWGAGAVPAHPHADAFARWGEEADADGLLPFDAMIALGLRECIVAGECLIVFIMRPEGLKLRLLPAEQLDESLSSDLGGGAQIAAGIETDGRGVRVAYWIRPTLPSTAFETYAPPVRIPAEDVVHLYRPLAVGQTRGMSWLTPCLLKLADLNLLSDALLKNSQVSALNSVYLVDTEAQTKLPYDGDAKGNVLEDVSLEPGMAKVLRGKWEMKSHAPQQAQQSIEFMQSQIDAVSAGLGVPSFMLSHNVSRANYSSLRAALITFKSDVEAWQFSMLVPALNRIWRRWAMVEALNGADADAALPAWRFQAMPEADPLKQVQAVVAALEAKIMSRREAIEARGEIIDRVNADIASDPFATLERYIA